VFVLFLNLAGFFGGMANLLLSKTSQREMAILYLLWTAYNLMLLAAMFAVAEEAKQVLKHTRMRLHMPAMIKLPSGRTVSCATENFPASVLGLSLPMPVAVEAGSSVSISIFHGHRELVFPAMVVLRQEQTLRVRIADTAQNDYQTFALAVLSRGPEWPKWLPGRGADRPFPKWVTDAFVAVPIAILDFVTNISKHLHWARLDSWIQLWKKKK
jgi:cellulose synthase (UDP-forming)